MVDGDEHCSQHQRAGAPELHGQQRCVARPRPSPVTLTPPPTGPRVLFTLVLQADIAAKVKVVEAAAAGVCGLCSYAPLPASCPAAAEVAVVARRL
jgi:hypothetical protein